MLPLWVSVVAASALAAPAPGAGGQRRGAIQAWPDAPNVLLVVSDSFVSMERQGRGRPAAQPRLAQPFPCLQASGSRIWDFQTRFILMQSKKCILPWRPVQTYVHYIDMHVTHIKTCFSKTQSDSHLSKFFFFFLCWPIKLLINFQSISPLDSLVGKNNILHQRKSLLAFQRSMYFYYPVVW